ncbi:hypothetical protein ILUMI_21210 [Ignelater luminosus]|uniref:Uncharacterized protein n=1 Tax=Ignelater luminosus TaxID=2038154 RepID=A0A8K0CCT9_IGNLU|nr:hypothetical protein ILUMI_21210 [Ignelater luminosus]
MSAREAAEKFQVPRSTLGDRLKAIKTGETVDLALQMGRFKKTFTADMEKRLQSQEPRSHLMCEEASCARDKPAPSHYAQDATSLSSIQPGMQCLDEKMPSTERR